MLQVIQDYQKKLEAFCKENHIRRMLLIGSALGDDFDEENDIDLLVEFEPGHVPSFRFFEMEAELSDLLGRKADLNTPRSLHKAIRAEALAMGEVLFTCIP
jgi:predicted nucleotidyltransferase